MFLSFKREMELPSLRLEQGQRQAQKGACSLAPAHLERCAQVCPGGAHRVSNCAHNREALSLSHINIRCRVWGVPH